MLSCGSANMVHQSPRRDWSLGVAVFQPSPSLNEAGGPSLNAGARGTVGFAYFGPTMQPLKRSIVAVAATIRDFVVIRPPPLALRWIGHRMDRGRELLPASMILL